ncbi:MULTISPECIES: hypothetical protein [unclassified Chamaesiphon]|uniref:hypothetical protein n=1 Tax=unclassified Chamaesiphon TaxID=2620921 RepID=UPI00286C5901|nr:MULTISPECIES: hypothetical protein [unclassified Chamaesiphon]
MPKLLRNIHLITAKRAVVDRGGFDRIWVIGALDIRAEMEFRAHSTSYLKITAGDISSF